TNLVDDVQVADTQHRFLQDRGTGRPLVLETGMQLRGADLAAGDRTATLAPRITVTGGVVVRGDGCGHGGAHATASLLDVLRRSLDPTSGRLLRSSAACSALRRLRAAVGAVRRRGVVLPSMEKLPSQRPQHRSAIIASGGTNHQDPAKVRAWAFWA